MTYRSVMWRVTMWSSCHYLGSQHVFIVWTFPVFNVHVFLCFISGNGTCMEGWTETQGVHLPPYYYRESIAISNNFTCTTRNYIGISNDLTLTPRHWYGAAVTLTPRHWYGAAVKKQINLILCLILGQFRREDLPASSHQAGPKRQCGGCQEYQQ